MSLKLPVLAVVVAAFLAAACGGSKAPAESPSDASSAEAAEGGDAKPAAASETAATDDSAGGIPSDCFKPGGLCLPSPKFAKRLCANRFPSLALYLFANPKFARAYLTRKTEAWNASGGASAGGYLEFDEEVLLLVERKADLGGMQVSGSGAGYDALRWDGSCVTLSGEEVTQQRPPSPKTPKIEWRFLDDNVQEALRKGDKVNAAYMERRKECKGAVSGDVSSKCVKADNSLSEAIVSFVRNDAKLPTPTSLP